MSKELGETIWTKIGLRKNPFKPVRHKDMPEETVAFARVILAMRRDLMKTKLTVDDVLDGIIANNSMFS